MITFFLCLNSGTGTPECCSIPPFLPLCPYGSGGSTARYMICPCVPSGWLPLTYPLRRTAIYWHRSFLPYAWICHVPPLLCRHGGGAALRYRPLSLNRPAWTDIHPRGSAAVSCAVSMNSLPARLHLWYRLPS